MPREAATGGDRRALSWRVAAGLAFAAVAAMPALGDAQTPTLGGYYQNVGIGTSAALGAGAGALDAQRLRLMWRASADSLSLEAAYEQVLWLRSAAAAAGGGGLLSSTRSGGDWLHLGWTVHESERLSWHQRFDRLSFSYSRGSVSATIGRQAISWATTLFLTPADPFVPFDPADPFREYRTGIDAGRGQWFAGAFTVVDVVVRPAELPGERTLTALARAKTTVAGWELSAWGGAIHDEPGGAVGITHTLAGSALRGEAEVRRDTAGRAVTRFAVGADRRFELAARDLYVLVEYQHDPFAARRPEELLATAISRAATRRELQLLGRDESAVQLTYQAHPLVSAEMLVLWNLDDGSAMLSPAASISVSDNIAARLGVFVPAGRAGGTAAAPASEYGATPFAGYAALSVFF